MKQSFFRNCHSASHEIPRLLWNLKIHYRVHNSPPLVPILSHMQPVHTFPPNFPKVHSHLRLGIPYRLFPSGLPTKILYTF
jgi:hypothetical protein